MSQARPAAPSATLAADGVYITGWGVVSPLGIGADDFGAALAEERDALTDVTGMFEEKLPSPQAFALPDFRARDHLGRKGTRFFDRATALALVACDRALADTALTVTDTNRGKVGLVLGTTSGSVKSTSDFSRDTITQQRPYLVNPVLFPNAVMNCAAGQAAIWYGLKGVNTTLAAGRLAGITALRYASRGLSWGDADALLVGAVEEFSPHNAWLTHATGSSAPVGEGAAVFVLERGEALLSSGRRPDAELLAVASAYADPTAPAEFTEAFAACVRQALHKAEVDPADLWAVAPSSADPVETGALDAAGAGARHLPVTRLLGECRAAQGALQLAAVLAHHRRGTAPEGGPALITSFTPEGTIGAAVVRGWSR
ncbi:beta-ketoacyl synthase N-terminal-like domain-containing protein [Streptomyces lanatus]|uniref:Beta-ketoacyl synthase N-terminal-like domain-containing protein n=1 Tax=Streptomyces lanatus TaxID=66900 RepID=A0ABV1Y752_9ACTN|nr:beta-ketoacyl synthase N-terminal-like domain-containing protein [Streptomyces lanatus]GHH19676.1 3-oxoacyl-ACP synthase [Streptomyces lanatus]